MSRNPESTRTTTPKITEPITTTEALNAVIERFPVSVLSGSGY
jgi:hypothetical protein